MICRYVLFLCYLTCLTFGAKIAITDWGMNARHESVHVTVEDELIIIWQEELKKDAMLFVQEADFEKLNACPENTFKIIGNKSPTFLNIKNLTETDLKDKADKNGKFKFYLASQTNCPSEYLEVIVESLASEIDSGAGVYFLSVGLLLFSLFLSYILERFHVHFIAESGVLILVGAFASIIITNVTQEKVVSFEPGTFFFILLPAIIFESGYTFHKRNFFPNFGSILVFAFVGCLMSTLFIGGFVYGINKISIFSSDWSLFQSMVFGCLISATDPVATLSVYARFATDETLYGLVFGESVMNDAVALVLFRVLSSFQETSFTAKDLPAVFGLFSITFFGSTLLGIFFAAVTSMILKCTGMGRVPSIEIILLLIMGYFAYSLADVIELSGIVSIFFYGASSRHYCWYNISKGSQEASLLIFKVIADLSESSVFLYLGLSIFPISKNNLWLVLFGIIACLIGRAINIFPLAFIINLFRKKHKITYNIQIMMFHAGLRGAVAYALAIKADPDGSLGIQTVTQFIVLFTVFFFGGTTAPMLSWLKLIQTDEQAINIESIGRSDSFEDDDESLLLDEDEISHSSIPRLSMTNTRNELIKQRSKIAQWLYQFDERFIVPLLTNRQENAHPIFERIPNMTSSESPAFRPPNANLEEEDSDVGDVRLRIRDRNDSSFRNSDSYDSLEDEEELDDLNGALFAQRFNSDRFRSV